LYLFHSSLKYRRIAQFLIQPEEFLHIGHARGLELERADLPIIKVNNKPIIPGSSLKGAIRNEFARVLSGLPQEKRASLLGYTRLFTEKQDIMKNYESKQIVDEIKKSLSDPNSQTIGLIDLLFGSEIFASPTVFTDALPIEVKEEYSTIRYHVRIDIDTDAVKKGNLVEIEAVNPHVVFEFKIIYNSLDYGIKENPVDKAFDHLIKFLNNREMLLGGWRSRGYGLVKLSLKKDDTLGLGNLLQVG